jgi:hypothetical protein
MSVRRALALSAVAASLLAPPAARGDDPGMALRGEKGPPLVTLEKTNEPGVVSGSVQDSITAHVRSVDLATRQVVLNAGNGRVQTVVAGPEVKNLERLQRGDRVSIRFRAGLVLRLKGGDTATSAPEVSKELKSTSLGDELSGTEVVRARAVLSVVGIDPATKIVTLADADGRKYQVKAGQGVSLDHVKAGDRFTATWSAAMAVSVDPVYRE